MKRSILIFGVTLGTILCVNMIYMVHLCYTNPDFKSNDVVGYATMVIIFSMIFVGMWNYRKKEPGGFVSFADALIAGVYIAVIGCSMYVAAWLFYYYLFVPDFMDVYSAHLLKEAAQDSTVDFVVKTKEIQNYKELYANPFFVILITYMEVLPMALLVALISAWILKKNREKIDTHVAYIHIDGLPLWIIPISGWGSEGMDNAHKRMLAYKKSAETLGINIEFSSRLGTFQSYKNAPSVSKEIREHNERTFAAYESTIGADWRKQFNDNVQKILKE